MKSLISPFVKRLDTTIAIFIALLWCLYFIILWNSIIIQNESGIYAASIPVWADWVVHLTYTEVFSQWSFDEILNKSPLFAEGNFHYPPFPNSVSAVMVSLGFTSIQALKISSLLAALLLLFSILYLFKQLRFSYLLSSIGLSLFMLNGGLGFWYVLFSDAQGAINQSATHIADSGIIIQNFIRSEFLPQRSILFAGSLFVISIALIHKHLESFENKVDFRVMLIITVASSLMFLSSAHSFLALVIICFFYALQTLSSWKFWLVFGLLAGISNGLIYGLYYGVNDTSNFIKFAPLALAESSNLSLLKFIWLNYGFFILLYVFAFVRFQLWKNKLQVAGLMLFIIAYLWQFQPWIWDNTKLLTWAYLLMIPAILKLFNYLWGKSIIGKITTILLFAVMTFSAAIDNWNLVKPDRQLWTMFTAEEIELAEKIKVISQPDDLFLTHMSHTNWVHALAARQVYKGYSGWLWSYGLDIDYLESNSNAMLKGNLNLIKQKGIGYIVIDKYHQPSYVNQEALEQLFSVVLSTHRYVVYRVMVGG